eukprot:NODE_78_length_23131_cov_0.599427.p3 type:complete len:690 gc:universal NODE_78_length_23131_cov_0.599427:559-2628(+)
MSHEHEVHEIEENFILDQLSKKTMLSANPQMVHKLAQLYGKKMINNMAKKKSNDVEHDMDLMTFFSTLMELTIKKDDPPEEDECSDCESVSEVSDTGYDRTRYFSVSDHTSIAHLLVSEELRLKQNLMREREESKMQRQVQKDKQKQKREIEENEKLRLKELEQLEHQRKELEFARKKIEQEEFERRKLQARSKMERNCRKWLYHYADSAKPRFIDLIRLSEEFDEIPVCKLYELEYKFDPKREFQVEHFELVDSVAAHAFDLNKYESDDGIQSTPLHSAIRGALRNNDWTIVKFLFEKDIDYSIPDSDGMIPLHLGIHLDSPEFILSKLIEHSGPLIDEKDPKSGSTALHIASAKGNARCVRMLLQNKARFNLLNNSGKTAEECAKACYTPNNDKTDWNKITSLPGKCGSVSSYSACCHMLQSSREQAELERLEQIKQRDALRLEELEKLKIQEQKDEEARKKAANKVKMGDGFSLTPHYLESPPSKKKKNKKKNKKKDSTTTAVNNDVQSVQSSDRSRSTSNDSLFHTPSKTAVKMQLKNEIAPPPGFSGISASDLEKELLMQSKPAPAIDPIEHFLTRQTTPRSNNQFVKNNLKSIRGTPKPVRDGAQAPPAPPGFEVQVSDVQVLKPVGSILKTLQVDKNEREVFKQTRKKDSGFSLFSDTKPLFTSSALWGPTRTDQSDWFSNK